MMGLIAASHAGGGGREFCMFFHLRQYVQNLHILNSLLIIHFFKPIFELPRNPRQLQIHQ